ncbi:hypothetical protein D3C72_1611340 [compost metagenome]
MTDVVVLGRTEPELDAWTGLVAGHHGDVHTARFTVTTDLQGGDDHFAIQLLAGQEVIFVIPAVAVAVVTTFGHVECQRDDGTEGSQVGLEVDLAVVLVVVDVGLHGDTWNVAQNLDAEVWTFGSTRDWISEERVRHYVEDVRIKCRANRLIHGNVSLTSRGHTVSRSRRLMCTYHYVLQYLFQGSSFRYVSFSKTLP